jgi:uncharacterized membrane protein
VGERLTWVDVLLFDLFDALGSFFREHAMQLIVNLLSFIFAEEVALVRLPGQRVPGVSVFATLPGLQRFYASFKSRPHIAAYLTSDRRLPFKLPSTPLFDAALRVFVSSNLKIWYIL